MGFKLRYRGRLKDPADVGQLTLETEDICRSNGWKYHIWEEDWSIPADLRSEYVDGVMHYSGHAPIRGIGFMINDDSETVWLTFTPDGLLQSLLTIQNPTFTGNSADYPWQRIKTGFDGATTHLAVCSLFRYLSGKYFADFEVSDESGYWQHGDAEKLTVLINSAAQLEEELAALKAGETLNKEEKYAIIMRLIKEHGERSRL